MVVPEFEQTPEQKLSLHFILNVSHYGLEKSDDSLLSEVGARGRMIFTSFSAGYLFPLLRSSAIRFFTLSSKFSPKCVVANRDPRTVSGVRVRSEGSKFELQIICWSSSRIPNFPTGTDRFCP